MHLTELTDCNTWLSHIVLNADTNKIQELVKQENYSNEIDVVILLNGIEFTHEKLEKIIHGFVDQLVKQYEEENPELKRRTEYLATEAGLTEKAKELAKEMCYSMANKFEWG